MINFNIFLKKSILKILSIIFRSFNKKNNKQLKIAVNNLFEFKFHLLDLGAAEGLDARWNLILKNLLISSVEPHVQAAKDLKNNNIHVIEKVFGKKDNEQKSFYITKKGKCSSLLKPNFEILKKFNDPERYNIIETSIINTTTIDTEFKNNSPDFIKLDTQGSELDILHGGQDSLVNVLGIEIEVEFFKVYENQPLEKDIREYLENNNFQFIDFIDIVRWERDKFRFTGQPVFANSLYMKNTKYVIDKYNKKEFSKNKLYNYLIILIIYHRVDLIKNFIEILKKETDIKLDLNLIINIIEKKIIYINDLDEVNIYLKRILTNRNK